MMARGGTGSCGSPKRGAVVDLPSNHALCISSMLEETLSLKMPDVHFPASVAARACIYGPLLAREI